MTHRVLLIFCVLISAQLAAHPGGLDAQGGHTNSKTHEYHCHRDPCKSIHQQTDAATQEVIEESRPVSFVYRREDWKHWIDVDGDCMNTRHEMLQAQAVGKVKLSPDGCYVSMGTWHDPFSGKTYTRASDLDVDHIVPLKWANDHGGAGWSSQKKEQFANDPANLLVVDDGLNQSKGAQGPDQWMPPNHIYRCQYLALWQRVLSAYSDLKMTDAEERIYRRQVSACDAR